MPRVCGLAKPLLHGMPDQQTAASLQHSELRGRPTRVAPGQPSPCEKKTCLNNDNHSNHMSATLLGFAQNCAKLRTFNSELGYLSNCMHAKNMSATNSRLATKIVIIIIPYLNLLYNPSNINYGFTRMPKREVCPKTTFSIGQN